MYTILSHAHSGLRYAVLFFLIAAVAKAFSGWMGKKSYLPGDRKMATFTVIFSHVQLLLGLALYFSEAWYSRVATDPAQESMIRFFKMEHLAGMIIAIVLITIGSARAKRQNSDAKKHKTIAIFFGIGLLLILAMIPWPFLAKFAHLGWF